MGLATAQQVVAGGDAAVITGRDQDKVQTAVEASQNGRAWGLTAGLTDHDQVPKRSESSSPGFELEEHW